ncbi:LysR family transcriptional regulator [Selenomonas ruminantium]|uniref:DNA-binding transcriptional regulator, LysR family n=1 Tax=Selenomonas ruminantium TaxID=971 RepID=A0A1H0NB54_SELRU|nr:LysR family transcriptional regulator [Selenomonas ruminantium]SDO89893.1 DNA-binding transcriptional regulator, LysR family [Selenomonas ruminantium]
MNIQQMQYYAEVCRQENVTKAAATLHMSQSTLSLAMKNIEEDTGLNLFRHVGRNIQLTEDGQALFHEVEKMLKQVKRFESSVKEIAKRHNRLQLAVPSQIATVILPLLLGEFRQFHPEIQLEIIEPAGGAALDMVEREEVDLAFVHDAEGRPNLSLRKLSTWPICLCVPREHPLTNQKSIPLAKAAVYPLVLLSRNFILTRQVLAEFAKQKLQPQVLHYSPNLSSVWNIVQQGIALSILTGNGILPESGLTAIPIEGLQQKGFIVTKKGRQIYADERCLIDFVRHKFAAL